MISGGARAALVKPAQMVLDTRTVGPIHTARHDWEMDMHHDAVDRLSRTGMALWAGPSRPRGSRW